MDYKLTEESIFQIKKLKFHRTRVERLESIFDKGILSPREHGKRGVDYEESYGPEAQKRYGKQYISVFDLDGEKTDWESGYEKEYNVKYPRKLAPGKERRELIFSFFGAEYEICLVLHPKVKTLPKGECGYEHLVRNRISPQKILAVCYHKSYDFINNILFEKEEDGQKKKYDFLEACKKYKKPVFEVDDDTRTIIRVV